MPVLKIAHRNLPVIMPYDWLMPFWPVAGVVKMTRAWLATALSRLLPVWVCVCVCVAGEQRKSSQRSGGRTIVSRTTVGNSRSQGIQRYPSFKSVFSLQFSHVQSSAGVHASLKWLFTGTYLSTRKVRAAVGTAVAGASARSEIPPVVDFAAAKNSRTRTFPLTSGVPQRAARRRLGFLLTTLPRATARNT